MTHLTPVERTLLIVLMAEGRPLRESADLGNELKINVKVGHRKKLVDLGLVKATPRPWTLELTEKGWELLETSFPTDIPKDPMKLSGMQVMLARLRQQLSARGTGLQAFFTSDHALSDEVRTKTSVLETSPASDSDEYIASALQDIPSFAVRLKRLEPRVEEQGQRDLEQVALAAEGVFQNIRMAARRRGLEVRHEKGTDIPFDAAYYDCPLGAEHDEPVMVVKPAIVKGADSGEIIILRGLAQPYE